MSVEEVVAVARDVDVLTETVIRRPVAEVAAFAGDPANAPEWYANIDSVEWRTPPPMVAGSRLAFVARFLGRRLAYTYEVAELVIGERLVMRTAVGPFPMESTYTWEPLAAAILATVDPVARAIAPTVSPRTTWCSW